jgi:hypothetical protein
VKAGKTAADNRNLLLPNEGHVCLFNAASEEYRDDAAARL